MTHRELCVIGAKFIKRCKHWKIHRDYVAIELVCSSRETADVFGFSGWNKGQVLIEVKVSRSDFLSDKKKDFRRENYGLGVFRYYLCPDGLIKESELPDGWGLLYYKDRIGVEIVKIATEQERVNYDSQHSIMYSIIRRLAKPQIFDFRDNKPIPQQQTKLDL